MSLDIREMYSEWDEAIARGMATNNEDTNPDLLMVPIINAFRELGIYTEFCCQGHSLEEGSVTEIFSFERGWETAPSEGYVCFLRETFPSGLLLDLVSRDSLNPFYLLEIEDARIVIRWDYNSQEAALNELKSF